MAAIFCLQLSTPPNASNRLLAMLTNSIERAMFEVCLVLPRWQIADQVSSGQHLSAITTSDGIAALTTTSRWITPSNWWDQIGKHQRAAAA